MKKSWSELKTNYAAELENEITILQAKIDHADSTGQPTKAFNMMLKELVARLSYLNTEFPE